MWLEAIDLVLERLTASAPAGLLGRVRAVSGAGQQHGCVFWKAGAAARLTDLDAAYPLVDQLTDALSLAWAPNWQDHSTQAECDALEAALGGGDGRRRLADITGSGAHHRFTGAQIMRIRRRLPDVYARTARISLVSSWLASVLRGDIVPIDGSDACGMSLWNMCARCWNETLLAVVAGDGEPEPNPEPADRGGNASVPGATSTSADGGTLLGPVSPYFSARHGLSPCCQVVPFTGDNPVTMLALPLGPLDAIVSLGTSTTLLMNTPAY